MHTQYLSAFLLYLMILLGIGFVSHRSQNSNKEFIVGNRSLNFWLIALSAHASDMSAWLFMAFPAAIYMQGISGSWIAIGLLAGMLATWQLVAQKLRVQTEHLGAYTLPTFFESHFKDTSGVLRIITASVILFFLTFYLGAGLTAMGLLIESIFSIDYWIGVTIATFVVVCYTYGGGFNTIAWTDLFQAIFLLIVIIMVPILTLLNSQVAFSTLINLDNLKPNFTSLMGEQSPLAVLSAIFSAFAWGLGYFGMPHIVTKFLGIKDPKDIRKGRNVGMTWQFLALTAAVGVGIIGFARFQGTLEDPQLVFVELVKLLFNPFFAGFVLCGVLAANLSTMDSQLLVCASAIGEDFYKKIAGNDVKPATLVRASRAGVIIIALIALALAFNRNKTILEAVFYAWGGLGSAFGPLVLTALYDKKANRYGAICGIIVGTLIGSSWHLINPYITTLNIPSTLPGFTLNFLTIWIVSRQTTKRSYA